MGKKISQKDQKMKKLIIKKENNYRKKEDKIIVKEVKN